MVRKKHRNKSSFAHAGEGTTNPEEVQILHEKDTGRNYLTIRWDGGEYKGLKCWIQIPAEHAVDLDKNL